jgi:hypothetical protein
MDVAKKKRERLAKLEKALLKLKGKSATPKFSSSPIKKTYGVFPDTLTQTSQKRRLEFKCHSMDLYEVLILIMLTPPSTF